MQSLEELLSFIEEHLDETIIERSMEAHKKILHFEPVDALPARFSYPSMVPDRRPMEEVHADFGAMMYNELAGIADSVRVGDDALPMIRVNYGVGTVPSLFGLHSRIVNGNMPWVDHLESTEDIKRLVDRGVPDLDNGFGARIVETYRFYRDMLAKFPKCQQFIKIYHADAQGPLDIAHLIWGSDIFIGMYDEPELYHALMEVVTDTYIKFLERDLTLIDPSEEGYCYHWAGYYKGNILLRDDSSVNLSRDMYLEMVSPYLRKIAKHFGGAALHFCGRADQWVADLIETPEIESVNFGYMEERFDMDFLRKIQPVCEANKVAVIDYQMSLKEFADYDPSIFKTGMTISVHTKDFEQAKRMLAEWRGN